MKGMEYVSCLRDPKLLREKRKELGLTQAALSARSGVTRDWIACVERSRAPLAGEKALRVWEALADVDAERRKQPALKRLSDYGRPSEPGAPNSYADFPYSLVSLVVAQDKLIDMLKEALADVSSSQASRIAELEQEVLDLRSLYAAGELEALAHEKFRQLDEKLFPPSEGDDEQG